MPLPIGGRSQKQEEEARTGRVAVAERLLSFDAAGGRGGKQLLDVGAVDAEGYGVLHRWVMVGCG